MISFKLLTEQTKAELLQIIKQDSPKADHVFASDNMTLLLEDQRDREGEVEYAVTYCHGCLLFRTYEDEYSFMYPLPLCDGANPLMAAMEIRAYAVKEEIPLVYHDVRPGAIGELIPCFRHVNVDSDDHMNRFFTVRVMSEVALMDEEPSCYGFFGIALTPLTEEDDDNYFRLCSDEKTNAYWGYDYSQDEANPDKTYFRRVAESEFNRGVALSLAVRAQGIFVGEVTLYYFDLMGGCECAVRILPEYCGKGYATEALRALRTLAKRIGLNKLYATVAAENKASINLFEKMFNYSENLGETVRFTAKL